MANHRKDLTGIRRGKLVVVGPHESVNSRWTWVMKCDCGNTVIRTSTYIVKSTAKPSSCGCIHPLKTHGLTKANRNLQWVWIAMRQRCQNPGNKDYPNYGARGISVCTEWEDFETFHLWATLTGYHKGVTIERVDVNDGYHAGNCTWVPNVEQALNTRKVRMFEWRGKSYRIRELAVLAGISFFTMKTRLTSLGWSVDRAMGDAS